MNVDVDKGRCVGSATCVIVAPAAFTLDEHDRAEPTAAVGADLAAVDLAAVEQAAELCPTAAIRIGPAA